MKRIGIVGCALALSALCVTGCDKGDNLAPLGPEVDGGSDAEASVFGEAGADAAPDADAAVPSEAGDGGGPAYALFVGTDFANAELSVVSLHPDAIAGRLPIADGDSVPYASGGFGFVLEHTLGQAVVLDHAAPWTAKTTIDVNDAPEAGPLSANPRTVLVTTGTKAYVARYASNVVKVVDVATGTVTGGVDLSAFAAPDDPDGLVDVQDGAYDPATRRAYFLLERINQGDFSGSAPDYIGRCIASRGLIVAVDVTNDAIVNLNGGDAGESPAIELLGDNPAALTPDFAHGRFLVADAGCYSLPDGGADAGPTIRIGRGIESVAIAGAGSTWLYQTSALERLYGLIWIDGAHAYVNQGNVWFGWNPTEATLGSAIADFPLAPFYDGVARIVGLSVAAPDAGSDAGATWSVVAFDVATGVTSTIADRPFRSVVPSAPFGVASAFLP